MAMSILVCSFAACSDDNPKPGTGDEKELSEEYYAGGKLGTTFNQSATAYEDDDDGDPDDIPVDRKLNVAVTRAREQFFIVGNENVLRELRAYGELVRYIRNKSGAFGI